MRKLLIGLVVAGISIVPALSATSDGYATGGRIGNMSCPEFAATIGEIRALGDFNHDGVKLPVTVATLHQYFAGYRDAFNGWVQGVYDVFGPLEPNPYDKVLFAIEIYCKEHPTKQVLDGLYELLGTLAPEVYAKPLE